VLVLAAIAGWIVYSERNPTLPGPRERQFAKPPNVALEAVIAFFGFSPALSIACTALFFGVAQGGLLGLLFGLCLVGCALFLILYRPSVIVDTEAKVLRCSMGRPRAFRTTVVRFDAIRAFSIQAMTDARGKDRSYRLVAERTAGKPIMLVATFTRAEAESFASDLRQLVPLAA